MIKCAQGIDILYPDSPPVHLGVHGSHLLVMGMRTVSTVPPEAVPSPALSANTSLRVPSLAV